VDGQDDKYCHYQLWRMMNSSELSRTKNTKSPISKGGTANEEIPIKYLLVCKITRRCVNFFYSLLKNLLVVLIQIKTTFVFSYRMIMSVLLWVRAKLGRTGLGIAIVYNKYIRRRNVQCSSGDI
jgi:hypothetical protein